MQQYICERERAQPNKAWLGAQMVEWARYGSERVPPICAPPNEAIAAQVRCDWHPHNMAEMVKK